MCDYLVFIVVFSRFDQRMYIIFDVRFSEQNALGLPPDVLFLVTSVLQGFFLKFVNTNFKFLIKILQ